MEGFINFDTLQIIFLITFFSNFRFSMILLRPLHAGNEHLPLFPLVVESLQYFQLKARISLIDVYCWLVAFFLDQLHFFCMLNHTSASYHIMFVDKASVFIA